MFEGNPAAVCPLERWLDDATMHAIASENALSETAFFVADGPVVALRWFTPSAEVDLCGHATRAARGVVVTAPGSDVDLVSRFFAPAIGIPEDPVTGSTHCAVTFLRGVIEIAG